MTVTAAIKQRLRSLGIEVRRWPGDEYGYRRQQILASHRVGTALDVGANEGQYGGRLRAWGFSGLLHSFEPLSQPFAKLSERAGLDSAWHAHRLAVGETSGVVTLNVAANNAASSSVLPMMTLHAEAAPQATYVGKEEAEQVPLDALHGTLWPAGSPLHLKIDVQGYERAVLEGARQTLQDARTVELELSFAPLYEGGMLIAEALEWMASAGFALALIDPGFRDARTDLLLQADGLFVRV